MALTASALVRLPKLSRSETPRWGPSSFPLVSVFVRLILIHKMLRLDNGGPSIYRGDSQKTTVDGLGAA